MAARSFFELNHCLFETNNYIYITVVGTRKHDCNAIYSDYSWVLLYTHTLLMLLEYTGIALDLLSSEFVTHRSALALRTTCKKRKLHVPLCKQISMDTPN